MINTGLGLLKRAQELGYAIRVEDEDEHFLSAALAWSDVKAYIGSAKVTFYDRNGKYAGWAHLVHVNDPEEVLSDYGLIHPWIDECFNEMFEHNSKEG